MAAPTPDDQQPAAPKAEVIQNSNGLRELKLSGHVGFDSLPDQLVSKSVSQGFAFNILCVGETGLGKSTLMDTLFNTQFNCSPSTHMTENVTVKAQTYDLQESNVRLKLTVVDSVGYADQINKDDSVAPIIEYIDRQYEAFLQEELKIKRELFNYHDTRVHACLYFIAPTGHSLKSLDLLTMKQLDRKVNIIPVIAKSDIITKTELLKFKAKIMSELADSGVQIYYFPTDDETVAQTNQEMNGHLPFAVVGSTDEIKIGNKMVKARQYPWGTVQVENENHCDFVKLREMLLRTNMQDLVDTTHKKHYEVYRRVRLEEMGYSDTQGKTIRETYEKKRQAHVSDMATKEDEMRQMFVQRVKEKESELKEAEKQLQGKLEQLRVQHIEDKRRMENSKAVLEKEKLEFRKRQEMASNSTSATNLYKSKKK